MILNRNMLFAAVALAARSFPQRIWTQCPTAVSGRLILPKNDYKNHYIKCFAPKTFFNGFKLLYPGRRNPLDRTIILKAYRACMAE
jgi:hypothetical protein